MSRAPGKKQLAEVADHIADWKRSRKAIERYHEAIEREYNYCLKLDHHEAETVRNGVRQKVKALQVSTLDLYDINRYTTSQLAGAQTYVDVRAMEPGETPAEQLAQQEASEIAQAVVKEWCADTDLGYPHIKRSVIRMACAARAGACKLDVVPGGEHGADVVPSIVDPRNLSWDSRYAHFNHHGNRVLYERVLRVPLDEIEERYKNGDLVTRDDGEKPMKDADPKVQHEGEDAEVPSATLVIAWCMGEEEEVERKQTRALDPRDWYMACPTCGYTEKDLATRPEFDGQTLPESMPCPQCGETPEGLPAGEMQRIEAEPVLVSEPAYREGRRRFVFAPFSPDAGYLEDGPWPEGLTHFPYGMYVPDPFPIEPFGNSQTFLNMDMQSLKNATLAEGFLQMQRNRDRLLVKEDALWTAEHEPYQFDGSEDYVAYVSTYDDLMGMKHVQGAGLNQAFPAWWGTIDGELNKHRGIGQAALSPEQMKGVQVGTIARSIETGDVPLDEMLRIFREFEQQLLSRVLELIGGSWTHPSWHEVTGRDGRMVPRLFDPSRLPRMKLRVYAAPNLRGIDIERAKAMREMVAPGTPPTMVRFIGHEANLPPMMVEQLIEEMTPGASPVAPPPESSPGVDAVPPMPPETPAMRMAAV